MPKKRGAMIGRTAELAAVDEAVGQAVLLLVRGRAGMGKTTLLREVRHAWRTRGPGLVLIRCSSDTPRWDLFCAQAVLDGFRDAFPDIGDARLAEAMAAVGRLCLPATYRSDRARAALFTELVRLFTRLCRSAPGAVLIDDVHAAPDPALAIAAANRAGCTIVAASRDAGISTEPASFVTLADRVVDLDPLSERQVDDLLAGAVGELLDEAVAPVLRAALGTLAGIPGSVLGTLERLRRDGRFTRFQGYLCLRDPAIPPALPAHHWLVRQVALHGELGRRLLAVIAGATRFCMDDLLIFAEAFGHDIAACGRTVDSLVAAGALECDDHGVLRISCPALVTAVLPGTGADEAASVHRAIAEHLLSADDTLSPGPAVLAYHVALADAALPATPSFGPLLGREAAGALQARPALAARWYRVALRHCEPGVPRTRVLAALLPLLLRLADYEALADVVAETVQAGCDGQRPGELAAYAALAAVHTGRPMPAAEHEALVDDPASRGPLAFARRWFICGEPLRMSEPTYAFTGLTGEGPLGTVRPGDPAEAGGDLFDPVAWFKRVVGGGYGEPVTGPLAAYGRIRRNYLRGDWARIPSEARALELAALPDSPVHHAVRLLAAEVHSTLGDVERSTAWLERSSEDSPFPALRAWAAMGIAYRTGEWEQARKLGWTSYEELGDHVAEGGRVGIGWLLVRLVFVEWAGGDGEKLPLLHAETKRWHARLGGTSLRAAELIARALAERDYPSARTAADILREHGSRSELMRACMTAALLADEPRPWYHEAHEIAKSLGGGLQQTGIEAVMRDSGVAPPPERTSPAALSDLEARIVALVRQGLSNRQIAGKLRISEKTVENSLTRVYAKAGCRSRLDLTLAAMEGRLATQAPG
ncbi:AAA family ATPase [Streptomyces sp. NPDC006372]|uniref:helix-turn-helix transcriptional regulator n=1 Tax=Streptomyces sp. NPDC006372 TaxID=3155599 RepID=UPI0033AD53C9